MTPSKESLLNHPSLLDSTREELFHPGKSKLPLSSSSPVNLLDTPSLKVPRLLPNSLLPTTEKIRETERVKNSSTIINSLFHNITYSKVCQFKFIWCSTRSFHRVLLTQKQSFHSLCISFCNTSNILFA